MTEVSAGIVRNAQGLILACQRGEGRRNAHLWEFPGGKREPGEDAAACLQRELLEELNLPVEAVRPCLTAEEGGIRFTFLTARTDAAPVPTEHEDVRFLRARELLSLPFCPADAAVASALALNDPPLTDFFWDWDGTLFDTYPLMTAAFQEACARQGFRLSGQEALDLLKRSLSEAVETVSSRARLDSARLMVDFRAVEAVGLPDASLMSGMADALHALADAGCRHYLVTHRDQAALALLRERGLLPLFTGWVTREDGFPRKPDPAALLHLMEKYDVDPERACMIGDRPIDTEAARSAGILGCLFDPEDRFSAAPCHLRARDADRLPALLRPTAI